MRRAWLYLVLAGCYSEGSLEVWVEPGPGMTLSDVELYVGIHDPHIGESIRPVRGDLAETVWWKRDHNRSADILMWDAEAMARGAVRYQMLADELDSVRALVAVGYTNDGTARKVAGIATYIHDAEIGSGEIHRRYMTLGEFDLLPRPDTQPTRLNVPGIQIWGPPDDPTACVQIDNAPELDLGAYDAPNAKSAMIVTHDDRDCDGYTRTEDPDRDECVPVEFNSIEPRTRESLSCVVFEKVPQAAGGATTTVDACVAGGPTCMDGQGDLDCAPSVWCAPTAVCERNLTNPGCNDFVCDGLPTNTPHIECKMTYEPQSFRWCSGTKAAITLASYIPGIECDPTRVTMMRKPLMPAWSQMLEYGSIDPMWLTVTPRAQNLCEHEFKASGPLQVSSISNLRQESYGAAIAFPLTKPVNGRGLGLPIRFIGEPSPGCQEIAGSCALIEYYADPELAACIAAPITDPAQRIP